MHVAASMLDTYFLWVQDVNSAGFYLVECANVELKGPVTAYHAPHALPFTQATITNIADSPDSGYSWDLKVHF